MKVQYSHNWSGVEPLLQVCDEYSTNGIFRSDYKAQFVHRLGLCALALILKRYCEVVHASERDWVILPKHRLYELQRLPVHRLGLCVLSLQAKRYCEVVHAAERVWVILPERRLREI